MAGEVVSIDKDCWPSTVFDLRQPEKLIVSKLESNYTNTPEQSSERQGRTVNILVNISSIVFGDQQKHFYHNC